LKWGGITQAQTIIDTTSDKLHADPSQGSHFFHNITSLGINYLGVPLKSDSFINMEWLESLPVEIETDYLKYIELQQPGTLKINGKLSHGVLLPGDTATSSL